MAKKSKSSFIMQKNYIIYIIYFIFNKLIKQTTYIATWNSPSSILPSFAMTLQS